jgi:hypothetical protein
MAAKSANITIGAPNIKSSRTQYFNPTLYGIKLNQPVSSAANTPDLDPLYSSAINNNSKKKSQNYQSVTTTDLAPYINAKETPTTAMATTSNGSRSSSVNHSLAWKSYESNLSKNHIKKLKETLRLDDIPYVQTRQFLNSVESLKKPLPVKSVSTTYGHSSINSHNVDLTFRSSTASLVKLNPRGVSNFNRESANGGGGKQIDLGLSGTATAGSIGDGVAPMRIVITQKLRRDSEIHAPPPPSSPLGLVENYFVMHRT